ncbi:MAG: hypothetical protein Q4D19_06925 [Lautropia sp.]|nr:hypothetical protein [Lautropia sp.]
MSQVSLNEQAGTTENNKFVGRVMTRPAVFVYVVMALPFVAAYAIRTTPSKHLIALPWRDVAFFWHPAVIFIPLLLMLTVHRVRQPRFWVQGFLGSAVMLYLWNQVVDYLRRHPHVDEDRLLYAFHSSRDAVMWSLAAMALLLFLALPWLQTFVAEASPRRMKREMRSAFFWQMVFIVAVTWFFFRAHAYLRPVILRWVDSMPGGMLTILLAMMIMPVIHGICVSVGMYLVRSRRPIAVRMEGWMIQLLGKGMPAFAVAAVLVALGMLIPSLRESLLSEAHAPLFVWGPLLGMLLSINAAWWLGYQPAPDGELAASAGADRGSPRQSVHRLMLAGLFAVPVLAGALAYHMFSCVQRCGVGPDTVAMVLILVVLSLQSLGYIWAVFRRTGGWMEGIRPVNTAISVLAIVLCFAWLFLAFA